MDTEKPENLRDIVGTFVNAEKVQEYLDDIQAGEQILRDYPAPEPDEMLIANIKAEIALNILPRKVNLFRKIVYRTAAVAATVIVVYSIWIGLFENNSKISPPTYPAAADLFTWDRNAEYIKLEADKIEHQLMAIAQKADEELDSYEAIQELEINSAIINSDLWEG
jgi:hypothetical protein